MNGTLLLFVFLPIFAGLFVYLLKPAQNKGIAVLIQLTLVGLSAVWCSRDLSQAILVPLLQIPLPYGMALRIDRLGAFMMLISNLLFFLMVVFSFYKEYMTPLFLAIFLSLQGFINGVFLSVDIFNIYILVEVSTISVSILIMFKKDSQSMYDGMFYLMTNLVGMAFFLLGLGYLYKLFGVLDFVHLSKALPLLADKKALAIPFSLIFTGISLKSALLPLFSWLPKAHGTASAPSIVSAILSGVYVKTGVFLLLRVHEVFGAVIPLQELISVFGFATAIGGFVLAIAQSDIKLILAYHTVSQVGLILIGLGGGHPLNPVGGVYHILAHALFKGLLFLLAGVLIEIYGTRKISEMRGLWQRSKFLSATMIVAILSITGAPFFSGGFSKYFIAYGHEGIGFTVLFTLINAGTMTSFIKFFRILGGKFHKPKSAFRLRKNQSFVYAVMTGICLILGIFGEQVAAFVLGASLSYPIYRQAAKWLEYLALYALCALLFRLWIEKSAVLRWVNKLELTFNAVSLSIVGFFFFTFLYFQYRL
ncbi:MAG TPA: proton-conducting transporter membrane subunit [Thermotogota bacterium]|nr:proton-conducting transporter membrane subunit [Thermotogota bacterium]HNR62701.1 proton-conducting transporter membrane subunit [Thermotogota bacterium]HNT94707.1 proton-conducting transporter membrane subunit [Thermotogota bacterium]HOZ12944.1 proton-conducting transporter membrane subunit [Thermotogota bacterium]HPH11411.1 proton-conducting transporter membrane subunit [Thermotogota bacterium]